LTHFLIGLKQQLSKTLLVYHYSPLFSQPWLYINFDEHLTFFDQISALSKSCYYDIRKLRCIRPYLDFKTATTIATSIQSINQSEKYLTCPE